ncbi:MAG: ABC-type lipoprotein export system ATPase subunit [Rickettsiales bacterium]|jgi:ABC-type lipoprotein export system ATPase subunit
MLTCSNISYKIKDKTIIGNISFNLKSGDHLLILGPSGSGKTTLLCLLAALTKPTSGNIEYDGCDIYKLKPEKRDQFRGKNLGIIFQNFHLIKSLDVYQNIVLPAQMSDGKIDPEQINYYLKELDLEDQARQKISTLSVGQSQKLAVIRSFINKPKWILCDEPTSALDDANTDKLLKLLKSEAKKNKSSLIIVTHDKRVKSHFENNKIIEL